MGPASTIYDRLHEDLRQAVRLVERARTPDRTRGRERLFALSRHLRVRAIAESDAFSPLIKEWGDAVPLLLDADEEHEAALWLIDSLGREELTQTEWETKVAALSAYVQRRLEEKERRLCQQAKMILSHEGAVEVAKRFTAARQRARRSVTPAGPNLELDSAR